MGTTLVTVALGGAIGAVLRFLVVSAALRSFGPGFPWGTLLVNVLGSFAMGVIAVLLMERMPGSWRNVAPFLITGLLGGFTTFSAFSLDVWSLVERGRLAAAGAYAGGSLVLAVSALAAGLLVARGATQ
ncbi:MAG: fluoride efflux transporter CrcB [Pseudomonadota bacterium]